MLARGRGWGIDELIAKICTIAGTPNQPTYNGNIRKLSEIESQDFGLPRLDLVPTIRL